eukprot:14674405-Alexandrium_andersonii.AAC.1
MDCVGFSPSSPQAKPGTATRGLRLRLGRDGLVKVLGSTTKIPFAADLYPNEVRRRAERVAMSVARPMSLVRPARPGNVNMSQ